MVITAVSTISSERICLNPGSVDAIAVEGTLTGDYYPGQWVTYDKANNKWTILDTDTAGTLHAQVGVVGYVKRVLQDGTNTLKTIDDAWDTSEEPVVPIWISGIVIGFQVDLNAIANAGDDVMPSATGGSVTLGDGTYPPIASWASNAADGDTKGVFGLGKCKGMRWGRINA